MFWDLWKLQDEAYNNIESILWKTAYLADSRALHLLSERETASVSDSEFYDPVDFTPITAQRPEGDGCDKDQLDQSKPIVIAVYKFKCVLCTNSKRNMALLLHCAFKSEQKPDN